MTREEKNKKKQRELKSIEKKEKTHKWLKRLFIIITVIVILVGSLILYARYIATSGLIVKEQKIESERLPESFHGFKIIQFSDLHYGSTIFLPEVRNLVREINKRKPDLVVFTGDLIDKNTELKETERKALASELQKIEATVGKYAVTGNHDYQQDLFQTIMDESGFLILDNHSDLIYFESYDPILLVGLSSIYNGHRDIDTAFDYFKQEGHNQDIYTVTLLHEPDSLDNILTTYPTDLALAGHSHNGQVRLPYFGSIVKINGARKYSEPYYQVRNTDLYVSGGIGTSNYPFRLFNRPSIQFFRLMKKSQ